MQDIAIHATISATSAQADTITRARALELYRQGLAANTLRAQRDDVSRWATFVHEQTGLECDWHECLECWQPVTYGLVTVFVAWLGLTYASATVNLTLSTVKTYCKLATQAGHMSAEQYALINTVKGLHGQAAKRHETRASTKKQNWTRISDEQRARLLATPNTPQGRRDAVIVHILANLGLRVSELATLTVGDVDLAAKTLQVTRHKTMTQQTLRLYNGTLNAITNYLTLDRAGAQAGDLLLMGSNKWGQLIGNMSIIAIQKRVGCLGNEAGIDNLSPHDLRHDWATRAVARAPLSTVQAAGGWASPVMPLRYAAAGEIANDGLEL